MGVESFFGISDWPLLGAFVWILVEPLLRAPVCVCVCVVNISGLGIRGHVIFLRAAMRLSGGAGIFGARDVEALDFQGCGLIWG